jgi:hypothetical protein
VVAGSIEVNFPGYFCSTGLNLDADMKQTIQIFLLQLLISAVSAQTSNKGRFYIVNPGPTAMKEKVVSLVWSDFSKHFNITDTNLFRIVEVKKNMEVPVQLEYMGGKDVVHVLVQADIPAGDSVVFRVDKSRRSPVKARTYGRYVPERKDDFAWENDRIAFRAYGKALQSAKDNAHGLDVWVKRSKEMVINERYRRNDYHEDRGNGLDYYHVGFTMGAGNIALYWNDSVWYPGNYSRWELLDNGPLRTSFRLTYDPVVLNGYTVRSVKTITLDAGTYMNRITVQYDVDGIDSIPVAVGIITRKEPGITMTNEQKGVITYWEPAHPKFGTTGVAVVASGANKVNHMPLQMLLGTKIPASKPFTYFAGACWDREGVMTDDRKWSDWVVEFASQQQEASMPRVRYR